MTSSSAPQPAGNTTPCIGICRLDAEGFCEGCQRTMAEIVQWGRMSEAERHHVMQVILPRRRHKDR